MRSSRNHSECIFSCFRCCEVEIVESKNQSNLGCLVKLPVLCHNKWTTTSPHQPSPALTIPHQPSPALTIPHQPSPALTSPHQPSQSSMCTAQVKLNASVTHLYHTQYVLSESQHAGNQPETSLHTYSSFLILNALNILPN